MTPENKAFIRAEEAADLYSLDLHDSMYTTTTWKITRVPGGWIYTSHMPNVALSQVFVPLHFEFKNQEP